MCGRTSSNGKSRRRPAAVLAGNYFVKAGVFIKKSPCVQPQGPNSERNLYAPPEELCSKSYGMRKHCFLSLPANCRQAGLLNWASGLNQQAAFNLFMFSPTSIKVYYTNRQVQIEGAAFYRRPIKLILDTGCSMLDTGCWMLDARWRLFALLDSLFHLPADEMRSAAEKVDSDYK